jgi:sucrose-phosphate synthase
VAWLAGGYAGSPGGSPGKKGGEQVLSARSDAPSSAAAAAARDPFAHRVDGLYIVLASMHGLIRGTAMELGRDPDTGGQVK